MNKISLIFFIALLACSFIGVDAKKRKKKKSVFPRAFLDFEGRRTTRLSFVIAPSLENPSADFRVSRTDKSGNRTGAVIFFEDEANLSPGSSFPLAGNFGIGNEKGTTAKSSVSFQYGKKRKRRIFQATASEGTVTVQTDEKTGNNYLLVRAETTNGEIRAIDANGNEGELIKEVNLLWEMDLPFAYGYMTNYNKNCFQPRGAGSSECVESIDDTYSFK